MRSTYLIDYPPGTCAPLLHSDVLSSDWHVSEKALRTSTEHYLQHRFDLLGSGWTTVRYGIRCRGLHGFKYREGPAVENDPEGLWLQGRINPGNLPRARRIWRLVDPNYVPIDWQIDFKSGYRWSERRWYLFIPFRNGGGIDVKVPWELARMQHLTQLARAYALARGRQSGFREPEVYLREFRNQVLDFCATNPPRFGVNWRCTMDVAIRVANWVLTRDLFRRHGATFDAEFENVFVASVIDHAHYISGHLEWFEHGRGNHYLANICGLIFAAAALPRNEKTNEWLTFGADELLKEVAHQFHEDGSGAEASTAYHCLCAEMVIYASAVLLGLPNDMNALIRKRLEAAGMLDSRPQHGLFPRWFTARLEKMAEFVITISKPSNAIPQIGDNDSGRFFKLIPAFSEQSVARAKQRYENLFDYAELDDEEPYLMADHLDRRHVVAAACGLFHRSDLEKFSRSQKGEKLMVSSLADGMVLDSYHEGDPAMESSNVTIGSEDQRTRWLREWENTQPQRRALWIFRVGDRKDDETWMAYGFPDFGMYVFRLNNAYVCFRCGVMGKNVIGAHAHNDQLSLEVNIDGEDIVADPGSYLYMPVPEIRNRYRSVTAHFTPQASGVEPSSLDEHVFYLDFDNPGECLYFGPLGVVGRHQGPDFAFYRSVTLSDEGIRVHDWSTSHVLSDLEKIERPRFSTGYGMRLSGDGASRRD